MIGRMIGKLLCACGLHSWNTRHGLNSVQSCTRCGDFRPNLPPIAKRPKRAF